VRSENIEEILHNSDYRLGRLSLHHSDASTRYNSGTVMLRQPARRTASCIVIFGYIRRNKHQFYRFPLQFFYRTEEAAGSNPARSTHKPNCPGDALQGYRHQGKYYSIVYIPPCSLVGWCTHLLKGLIYFFRLENGGVF
jgi:hypothetical protein